MYFREYVCRFSRKSYYFCILGVSHLKWTPMNTLQWQFNRNLYIFIQENAFEIVVCETAAILSRPQSVNYMSQATSSPIGEHIEL